MPNRDMDRYPAPLDLTKNGECSRCGGCCSSIIPLVPGEWDRLKALIREKNLTARIPVGGKDAIYMFCPFLEQQDGKPCSCRIYDDRPAICKAFRCDLDTDATARIWVDMGMDPENTGEPANMWGLFNLTGLRYNGCDVEYEGAPMAQVLSTGGIRVQFQVGRPIGLKLKDGRTFPPSLIVNINRSIAAGGIMIFSHDDRGIVEVNFEDIDEIMTDSSYIIGESEGKPDAEKEN